MLLIYEFAFILSFLKKSKKKIGLTGKPLCRRPARSKQRPGPIRRGHARAHARIAVDHAGGLDELGSSAISSPEAKRPPWLAGRRPRRLGRGATSTRRITSSVPSTWLSSSSSSLPPRSPSGTASRSSASTRCAPLSRGGSRDL
jgi:hypothetical protein